MTEEQDWLASHDPLRMLDSPDAWNHGDARAARQTPPRKRRLFAAACCRLIWAAIPSHAERGAVEAAQRYADAPTPGHRSVMKSCRNALRLVGGFGAAARWACLLDERQAAFEVARHVMRSHGIAGVPPQQLADLLRDTLGNPFRLPGSFVASPCPLCGGTPQPVTCSRCGGSGRYREADWFLTRQVLSVAQLAYDLRLDDGRLDPARLAVLSDCLEEHGCGDAAVLGPLRGKTPCPGDRKLELPCSGGLLLAGYGTGPHALCGSTGWVAAGPRYRGFHVLDLVLGKE